MIPSSFNLGQVIEPFGTTAILRKALRLFLPSCLIRKWRRPLRGVVEAHPKHLREKVDGVAGLTPSTIEQQRRHVPPNPRPAKIVLLPT